MKPENTPPNPGMMTLQDGSTLELTAGALTFSGTAEGIQVVPVRAKPTPETLELRAQIAALEADVSQLQAVASLLEARIEMLEGRP